MCERFLDLSPQEALAHLPLFPHATVQWDHKMKSYQMLSFKVLSSHVDPKFVIQIIHIFFIELINLNIFDFIF